MMIVVVLVLAGCSSSAMPTSSPELFDWLEEQGLTCAGDGDERLCGVGRNTGQEPALVQVKATGDAVELSVPEYLLVLPGDITQLLDLFAAVMEWPDGTVSRMLDTRPLDGTQRDGDVSWQYSSDGLRVVTS